MADEHEMNLMKKFAKAHKWDCALLVFKDDHVIAYEELAHDPHCEPLHEVTIIRSLRELRQWAGY